MISGPMRRLPSAGLLLASLALAACTEAPPSATASLDQPATASASPEPSQGVLPSAAQPYDAAALLAAMQNSTRPGGVPGQLETDAIAAAVAQRIWTWDGQPWDIFSVGGACGGSECSLDVAGSADGMAGTDLYSFTVMPGNAAVSLASSDLHGYPAALGAALDEIARAAAGDEIGDLAFVSARWLPPPDEGRYWLAYRSGGEEGAPGLDLLLDAATGEIVGRREV
jgi:hypothetical protein